jgi:hypothetical protein
MKKWGQLVIKVLLFLLKANSLALKMSMFVLVHVIQFGVNNIEAFWISFDEPPAESSHNK